MVAQAPSTVTLAKQLAADRAGCSFILVLCPLPPAEQFPHRDLRLKKTRRCALFACQAQQSNSPNKLMTGSTTSGWCFHGCEKYWLHIWHKRWLVAQTRPVVRQLPQHAVFSVLPAAHTIQICPMKDHACLLPLLVVWLPQSAGKCNKMQWLFTPILLVLPGIVTAAVAAAGRQCSVPKQEWDL